MGTDVDRAATAWWRVFALTAAQVVLVVAVQALWVLYGPPLPGSADLVLLTVLAVLFLLAEKFTVVFPVRRGAHVISLSEIPLVLSLLLLPPALLIPVRLAGALAGLTIFRHQRGSKLAFNTALYLTQTAVAGALFHLVTLGSDRYGPVGWLAAYAATFAADLVSIVLISAVIAVHDDSQEWHRLLTADVKQLLQLPLVAVTTTLALITALLVRERVSAALLLGILAFAAHLVFRRYAEQTRVSQRIEDVYRFTSSLDGLTDPDAVARTVLGQVRDLIRAETAELIVPGDHGAMRLRLYGMDQFESVPLTAGDHWWGPAQDGTPVLLDTDQGIAVPLRLGESTGVLLVMECMPDTAEFTTDHVRLLQAMSSHAGAALSEVHLVERLRHTASHDPLTDLPNRRQFTADLQAATDAVRASPGGTVGVLLLDLDRFKDVNDALGHDVGDDLLREIGRRLHDDFGRYGTVARLGGDEFALILRDAGEREIAELAAEVRRTVELPVPVGDLTLTAQASIGVALAPEHGLDADRLLRRADVAMYAAKDSRAGVRVYQPGDDRDTARRLTLVTDLRAAIDSDALTVVYQPKVDPRTGRVLGAEALTRWAHENGPVPPDEFIPLAERSGLIHPLTRRVLDTALADCATWRRAGHLISVAVNISPQIVADQGLADRVREVLHRHGVPAEALTLEITENGIMADPAGSRRTLDALHELGVKLSVDDFGTGHSSLGRLAHLPIHEVKIDKSFVRHIVTDRNRRAVTDAALQLGRALGLTVVAEGVEDESEFEYLRTHECSAVQGYFIARPAGHSAFLAWLGARAASDVSRVA
ncbi:putative bifunctional diguanylate cyclase/phosphodiesterase [Actinoplanes sp. GCM10030250]|uniref:putative bifunctional diguanylate cyclase/phosphodiesterase n=1 Tax=Actinoplanes sp. GCM10030250 TaxID=3273376 RepID=UPI0036134853